MGPAPSSQCKVGATLGEGPIWIEREQALYFVDIKAPAIFRLDPNTGTLRSWKAPRQVGWILPAADGSLVVGMQGGLHRFDPATGTFDLIVEVEAGQPSNRLNDACTDPMGRIWFGSMDDSERERSGAYYVYHRGALRRADLPAVAITNGPAISTDGRILYHVDTLGGAIFATDIGEDGETSGTRLFAKIDPSEGYQDGPTVDSEGHLWIGLFAGGEARRYAPDGQLAARVAFPVSNITKLAFGGPELRTAFATTARLHLKPDQLVDQPEAGDLFAFEAPAPGVAATPAVL